MKSMTKRIPILSPSIAGTGSDAAMMRRLLSAPLLWLALLAGAAAQFTDERTWGGISGGGANAQTIVIPNWTENMPGVALRFIAGLSNTGGATLNVSGRGAIPIKKQTETGLVDLVGGEIVAGQIYTVIYDGTLFQLLG